MDAGALLKAVHTPAHHGDTAFDRRLLRAIEAAQDFDHQRQLAHQVALGLDGLQRQLRAQLRRQRGGVGTTSDHFDEGLLVAALVGGREGGIVLDGVGDAAQQIGVGNYAVQLSRQLRNGQRKGARNQWQDEVLKCLRGTGPNLFFKWGVGHVEKTGRGTLQRGGQQGKACGAT